MSTRDASGRAREASGIPTGGRFAADQKREGTISLSRHAVTPLRAAELRASDAAASLDLARAALRPLEDDVDRATLGVLAAKVREFWPTASMVNVSWAGRDAPWLGWILDESGQLFDAQSGIEGGWENTAKVAEEAKELLGTIKRKSALDALTSMSNSSVHTYTVTLNQVS